MELILYKSIGISITKQKFYKLHTNKKETASTMTNTITKKILYTYSTAFLCVIYMGGFPIPAKAQNSTPVGLGNITGSGDMKLDPITTREQTLGRSDVSVTVQSDDYGYDDDEDIYYLSPSYSIDDNSPNVTERNNVEDALSLEAISERAQ